MCLQCDVNELKNLRVVDVIDGDVLLVMHLPSTRTHVLKVSGNKVVYYSDRR